MKPGDTLLLEGIVGSHAYGLNGPDSDIDTAGVFVAPLETILGLSGYTETYCKNDGVDKEANPDKTYHEIKKFLGLVLKANPTVTEMLWLDTYTHVHPAAQHLIEARQLFVSQLVRKTYVGYARAQMERFRKTGNYGSDLKKRQHKNSRHIWRLLIQAEHALKHGEIHVRLTPYERDCCFTFADYQLQYPKWGLAWTNEFIAEIDAIKSDLPVLPDFDTANNLLLYIRNEVGSENAI